MSDRHAKYAATFKIQATIPIYADTREEAVKLAKLYENYIYPHLVYEGTKYDAVTLLSVSEEKEDTE